MMQDFDENPLPALLDWRRRDGAGALVTLVRKTASGPRPLGALLAVSAGGDSRGMISGGCVEGGIVGDALAAMAEGRNRVARFGEGSAYLDLQMPCGGALDVHVNVTVATETLGRLVDAGAARRAVVMVTDTARGDTSLEPPRPGDDDTFATADLAWCSDTIFRRLHRPTPRVILAGRGPVLSLTAQIAALNGYQVEVMTDDDHAAARAAPYCATPPRAISPAAVGAVPIDSTTAVVTLFHDHDVERPLLRRALDSPAFHVGALGSRTTHAARLAWLADEGFGATARARIEGPAGVPIHAANPAEIATSIMAGVIRAYRRRRPSVARPQSPPHQTAP